MALKLLSFYQSLVAPRVLVNMHEVWKNNVEIGEPERKAGNFKLVLDHGKEMHEIKSVLIGCLENQMRLYAPMEVSGQPPLPALGDGEVAKRFLVYVQKTPTEMERNVRARTEAADAVGGGADAAAVDGDKGKGKDKGKAKGKKGKDGKGKGKGKKAKGRGKGRGRA